MCLCAGQHVIACVHHSDMAPGVLKLQLHQRSSWGLQEDGNGWPRRLCRLIF